MELDEKLALIDRWRRVILHDLDAVVALCTEDVELDAERGETPDLRKARDLFVRSAVSAAA